MTTDLQTGSTNTLKKTQILVVEDEIVVASEIKLRLENMGYQVVGIVNNGIAAISKARDLKPDIILMDITLKGDMTGLEATREISSFSDVPIIFVTAHSDKTTLENARAASAHGIFTKPFSDVELKAAIQQALISNVLSRFLETDADADA